MTSIDYEPDRALTIEGYETVSNAMKALWPSTDLSCDSSYGIPLLVPLSSLAGWMDKHSIQSLLENFKSDDRKSDVFLRGQATDLDAHSVSKTYLFIDLYSEPRIVGFFTVGFGHICIPSYEEVPDELTSALNVSPSTGYAPTYVISHLCISSDSDLPPNVVLKAALSIINQSRIRVGCRTIRLDCQDSKIQFYEAMGFTFIRKNYGKDINHMLMLA